MKQYSPLWKRWYFGAPKNQMMKFTNGNILVPIFVAITILTGVAAYALGVSLTGFGFAIIAFNLLIATIRIFNIRKFWGYIFNQIVWGSIFGILIIFLS